MLACEACHWDVAKKGEENKKLQTSNTQSRGTAKAVRLLIQWFVSRIKISGCLSDSESSRLQPRACFWLDKE